MKKHRMVSAILAILLLLPCVLSSSLAEQADTSRMYAIASRPFLAETFEELIEASEVVLIGQVVSQRPEIRHDLVFTYSSVRVNQIVTGSLAEPAAMIDVLQTGGSANGMYTPALADEPLMHIGEAYLLCLTYAPEDGQYQAYYLPTGGGQGILPFTDIAQASQPTQSAASAELAGADTALAQVLARAEAVFAGRDYGCCEVMSGLYGDGQDPVSGGHWLINSVGFYIYGESSIGSTLLSKIRSGFSVWNRTGADFEYYETSSVANPDVMVFCSYYGNTSWEAITSFRNGDGEFGTDSHHYANEYSQVKIQFNQSKLGGYGASKLAGIAGHEAGHALGLAHVNASYDASAIMIPDTETRTATRPSDIEKRAVIEIYGE